jgi:hypothetical protein
MPGWHQNFYKVKHREKYIGPDVDNVVFRSSWEKKMFEFLDNNPYVLAWGSEIEPIHYMKPVSDEKGNLRVRPAKYYPDVYVEYVNENKEFKKELIEIKPEKQTKPSKSRKASVKLQENYIHAVNTAKWEAARQWCEERDIEFKIYTEKSVYKTKK